MIEGEGCFTLFRQASKKSSYCKFTMQMTDRDVVERVAALLGAKMYNCGARQQTHFKPAYGITIVGRRAMQFFLEVEPFMSVRRRERIRQLLDQFTVPADLELFGFAVAQ